MLTEENIQHCTLEITVQESDWQKISKAIDKIKIKDIRQEFSLPMEFDEAIDKTPRKVFRCRDYVLMVSPKIIRTRFSEPMRFEFPPKKKKIARRKIFEEMQTNYNLFLGMVLGGISKTIKTLEVDWEIRFKFPSTEHLVQNTTTVSFIEKLKKFGATSNFTITQIMIVQELPEDKKITYEILEDFDGNTHVEIKKKFKSVPTTFKIVELVQDSIRIGNNMINLLRG